MIKELIDISKKLEGTVLLIGFSEDDKLYKTLDNNNKLLLFSHLTNKDKKKKKKEKKKFFGNKTINIKKLYKELKKEHYDYIICDFETIKPYFNNFIRNSYKITNKKIYFILNEDTYDYEEVERRYDRYNASTISKGKDEEYLIDIDVANMKMNIFKRFLYSFRDFGYNVIEFIATIIIS